MMAEGPFPLDLDIGGRWKALRILDQNQELPKTGYSSLKMEERLALMEARMVLPSNLFCFEE